MATFESCQDKQTESMEYKKFPLRRLEPAIQKFLKVIQIDLARLHRHKLNMERYNRLQDWTSLHTEQINATRTIQQVKANVREIEKSRHQVQQCDVEAFDDKIRNMKDGALKAVQEVLNVYQGRSQDETGCSGEDSSPGSAQPCSSQDSVVHSNHVHDNLLQSQIQFPESTENTKVAESWECLQENLEELSELIHTFATAVNDQQEVIDRIEDNIEHAQTDVREGVKHLAKASGYKTAVFPIAGAVIGTVVAGPVGLFAGAKIGGVIGAVGGGAAGFFSGSFWKKRREKATELELTHLSRANSLPDVATETNQKSLGRKRNQSSAEVDST